MRSARRASTFGLVAVPLTVLLSGCVTTQRIAARARLVNDRIRISQSPLRIGAANPDVRVGAPTLIRSPAGTAIAVRILNESATALTDLPVAVGVATGTGHRRYLNRSGNLDYFASHVAAIAPHGTATWVFTTGRLPARDGRPFVTVGDRQVDSPAPAALPLITVTQRRAVGATGRATVALTVSNRSAIPQYDLPIYAVATRGGRAVAAGAAAVAHLGTHSSTTLRLTVLGDSRAGLELSATPTIFN